MGQNYAYCLVPTNLHFDQITVVFGVPGSHINLEPISDVPSKIEQVLFPTAIVMLACDCEYLRENARGRYRVIHVSVEVSLPRG